jgi:hypothetical protein
MSRKNKPEYIVADVTEEEYRKELARGLEPDEVLLPGRHKFRRGGFLKRHGLASAKISAPLKVSISVRADDYIPNRSEVSGSSSVSSCAETLLSDKHFIEAVALRVKELNSSAGL